jgi:hypothetical protein
MDAKDHYTLHLEERHVDIKRMNQALEAKLKAEESKAAVRHQFSANRIKELESQGDIFTGLLMERDTKITELEAEVAEFKTCSYSMCHMWKLRDGSA